ncbi:Uncharacterised protein [Mycobacteroides abscessus subsp. abscessus]|nr:Uncharacterised protein [Mycobacteroides abscessus subsp. abscessus]
MLFEDRGERSRRRPDRIVNDSAPATPLLAIAENRVVDRCEGVQARNDSGERAPQQLAAHGQFLARAVGKPQRREIDVCFLFVAEHGGSYLG